MRQAAELITRFVGGKTFAECQLDPLLRSAVERQLAIIGEALEQLPKIDAASAASITGRRRIIALRNVLIHAYARVDDRVIWGILKRDLPALRREVSGLLADGPGPVAD